MPWAALALVVAARIAVAARPTTLGWGFDSFRYIPPALAWCLGALCVLSLIPPLCRALAPGIDWAGRNGWILPAVAGLLIWTMPDRLHFIGDSLMRQGWNVRFDFARLNPQALPLDPLLHVQLPRWLSERLAVANPLQLIGLGEALLMCLIAVGFARALTGSGSLRAAIVSMTALSGYMILYAGLNKAPMEMCLVVGATALLASLAVSRGTHLITLGLVVGLALGIHRMSVALLPALLVASIFWWKRHARQTRMAWMQVVGAWVAPGLVAAALLPRIIRLYVTFDLPHHVLTAGASAGSLLGNVLSPAHLFDLVNLFGVLAPASLLVLPLVFSLSRSDLKAPETLVLLSLALPFVLLMLFLRPQQGVFRDLDVFAPAVVAVTFLAAWFLRAAMSHGSGEHLAVAVVVVTLTSTWAWFDLNHSEERGTARIMAFVQGTPARSDAERALTWDFLGMTAMNRGDWPAAAHDWREAVVHAPGPRILTLAGMAEQMMNDLERARALYVRSLNIDPAQRLAWRGLASSSFRLGDYVLARKAVRELQRLGETPPELPDLVRELDEIDKSRGIP